jgi:hypothetical protein
MMVDPLARLLPPPAAWNDPLFRTDARAVKWGVSWVVLRGRVFRWGVQMLLVLALGLLVLAVFRVPTLASINQYSYYSPLSFLGEFIAMAFVGSIALNLILDFVGISGALGTISNDFNMRRSDLIRTSLLRPTQIVEAKHKVAQVRVLRMTVRSLWGRVWIVVLIAAAGLWSLLDSWFSYRGPALFPTIATGIIGALTAITYIMEPYWRMRAVTSLGVALSARAMHGASATLNAGFSLIAFWIGQIVVISGLAFVLQLTFTFYVGEDWIAFALLFAYWGIITATIYAFYARIVRSSLYQAAHRLATMDN